MDLTTAVTSLGNDYVNKVSDLLTNNSVTSTNTSQDSTFDQYLIQFQDFWIALIIISSRHSRQRLTLHLAI